VDKPIIGIDFDTKSVSLACVQDGAVLWAVRIQGSQKAINGFIDGAVFGKQYDVAIEDVQYQKNARTYRQLIERRQELCWHLHSVPNTKYYNVSNQSWTTAMLGVPANSKRAQRKQASKKIASSLAGYEITDDNIADAVCIAFYAEGLRKKKELEGK